MGDNSDQDRFFQSFLENISSLAPLHVSVGLAIWLVPNLLTDPASADITFTTKRRVHTSKEV